MRFLILSLLILFAISPARTQDVDIPYIHYFDELREVLVIERADGTDSRVIPDVPRGSVQWSASGKWMLIGKETIISTDGSRRIAFPVTLTDFYGRQPVWSPYGDYLLISEWVFSTGELRAVIFDVEKERLLSDLAFNNWRLDSPELSLFWARDGQSAYVTWRYGYLGLYLDGRTVLRSNGLTGDRELLQGNRIISFAPISHERQRTTFLIDDIETGRQVEIVLPGRRQQLPNVSWSGTGRFAVLYAPECDSPGCEIIFDLLDWDAGALTSLSPVLYIENEDATCLFYSSCLQYWSPDENYVAVKDRENRLYLVDVRTATTRQITEPAAEVSFHWLPDSHLFIAFDYQDFRALLYDPTTGVESQINLPIQRALLPVFTSLDGNFLGLSSNPATIIDREGNPIAQTSMHSHSSDSYCCPTSYLWDVNNQWVMANYPIFFSGGGIGPGAAVLFNMAGATRRELPTGGGSDFVPVHARPYLSPGQPLSPKREPIFTLSQQGEIFGLGWHPTDPNQLVVYGADSGFVFWNIGGGQPQITGTLMPEDSVDLRSLLRMPSVIDWRPDENMLFFGQAITVDLATGSMTRRETRRDMLLYFHDGAYIFRSDTIPMTLTTIDVPLSPQDSTILPVNGGFVVAQNWEPGMKYWVDGVTKDVMLMTTSPTNLRLYKPQTMDARAGILAMGSSIHCCIEIASTIDGRHLDTFYATAVTLALSPDGQRLATGANGLISFWDTSIYLDAD